MFESPGDFKIAESHLLVVAVIDSSGLTRVAITEAFPWKATVHTSRKQFYTIR